MYIKYIVFSRVLSRKKDDFEQTVYILQLIKNDYERIYFEMTKMASSLNRFLCHFVPKWVINLALFM